MSYFTNLYLGDPQYARMAEEILRGANKIYLHGLIPQSTGHLILSLSENLKRPVLVVCENQRRARELANQINDFLPDRALCFEEEELQFFHTDTSSTPALGTQIQAMSRLAQGDRVLVTTTLSALGRRLTPPRDFAASGFSLSLGDEVEMEDLVLRLHRMMYERVTTVEHRGQYSVRGGILDCYPMFGEDAFRIEFFDTEVDSIRHMDIESQRSHDSIDTVTIHPATSLQFSEDAVEEVCKNLRKELFQSSESFHYGLDVDRRQEKFEVLLDRVEEEKQIGESDLFAPYLPRDAYAYLYDYLPTEGLVVFEDLTRIFDGARTRQKTLEESMTRLLERGEILEGHLHLLEGPSKILQNLKPYVNINITQILKQLGLFRPDVLIRMRSMEADRFNRRWEEFVAMLRQRQSQSYRILICAGAGFVALQMRLREADVGFTLADENLETLEEGKIYLSDLSVDAGFHYPDTRLYVTTMSEITGKERRRQKRFSTEKKRNFLDYQDLEPGDFVVHESYGIGEYAGTETMEIAGVTKDYLKILYKAGDTLFVPTDEMHLIAKYIGKDGAAPRLSGLGGSEWEKSKQKVKKAVDAIAEDLVELYAHRSKAKGYAFASDSQWQNDFEAAFPYEETPSQLRAISEIKEDMESDKPMDRLLCGDVGYGKTEVALRAAFKAMMDGKQVAFLCPTTILTQQHYQTMVERFLQFPARIEFLSRFKTQDQQKHIVEALKEGSVDIVVGTHRLLSKDIHFKDLGLLIIDEEQRFGVKDKEKIKKLRENVDVLTLSATPIPRTLQLSLSGIRDMSLLEEPPEDRIPTTTYVMEYDPRVIGDALNRELDRGGQVYFVHNRVYDIHSVAEHLQALVPDARIAIAHGQMSTMELENVMEDFVSGQVDILLSTTIIETGMDIPNVNTLVVTNADHMGLSQLYQLKGRIGRSERNSYAYFTYEPQKVISEISEKRLKAIRDFTEFGSGYKIAMRDLQLRGAGNLLGESQSGHIESIGYELYLKLLEEAVSKAKGEDTRQRLEEINVEMKVDAFIPESYIPQTSDKIMMYRKIAAIENEEEYSTIIEELIDRFGDVPPSVVNVMDIVLIKKWATEIGFTRIVEKEGFVNLHYDKFEDFSVESLKEISTRYEGPLSFDFQDKPKFKIASTANKIKDVYQLLKLILEIKKSTKSEGKNEKEQHD